ncbi:MAG: hypothetical protein LBO62_04645 [Endomicrobium sp.]|jgi:hypothetical protein|nr:hypothetical protein [Endomicrobium sp.]
MKKLLFTLSALIFFIPFVFSAQSENIGRNIYAIYSENFNGVKIDWNLWTGQLNNGTATETAINISSDNAREWPDTWRGSGGVATYNIVESTYSSTESKDGNKFLRHTITLRGLNASSAWDIICFVDNNDAPISRNMSGYAGGKLEFWARSSSQDTQNLKIGIKANNANRLTTLGNAGFTADGFWHKISIDLNTLVGNNTTWLNYVSAPFVVVAEYYASADIIIDFDCIVWKKAGNAVSWDAKLMDVSTNQQSTSAEIKWTMPNGIPNGWKVADQYFELNLDCIPNDNWGIQIFSDTKSSNANPKYTGTSTDTAFGLIDTVDTTKMLPLAWRVTDKVLPYVGTENPVTGDYSQTLSIGFFPGGNISGVAEYVNAGLYDSGSVAPNSQAYHPWFYLKDKAQYNNNDAALEADEYIRVWDKRGFHASPDAYWGMVPGAMINLKIAPKLYLAADFSQAFAPATYKNNTIILRLFHE